MFRALVPDGLRFVRKSLKETVATVNSNLVAACFNVMDSLLAPYVRTEGFNDLTAEEKAKLGDMLPAFFLFSVIWSLGASCDKGGRAPFDR